MFDKYPQVRETHFQALLSSSNDMKTTLEKHGTKVLNAVGAMVSALKDEDDARLLAKISQVTLDSIYTDSIENVIAAKMFILFCKILIILLFPQITNNHWKRSITDTASYQVKYDFWFG